MTVSAHHGLPYPQRKPYIPVPHRAKAMTMAAAFECQDGYVLCADRLMTHGKHTEFGSFAHYEKKVFVLNDIDFAIAMCGSGDTLIMRAVANSVIGKLKDENNRPTLVSAFEETLSETTAKLGLAPDTSFILTSVTESGEAQSLRADGLLVQRSSEVEILGIGETSLVRYLIDSAYTFDMSLNELSALAAFIVYAAKKYCPQYCNGQTDVCVLPRKFMWDKIPMSEEKINELESFFAAKMPEQIKKIVQEAADKLTSSSPT